MIYEIYKDWCGKSHIINSGHPVHDSEECIEFAKYYYEKLQESDCSLNEHKKCPHLINNKCNHPGDCFFKKN